MVEIDKELTIVEVSSHSSCFQRPDLHTPCSGCFSPDLASSVAGTQRLVPPPNARPSA
jgi:hypothetical protein